MLSQTQSLFKSPVLKDEEQTRVAGLLHIVSLALLAALALAAITGALFGYSKSATALAFGMLGPLAALWLTRRGWLRAAGLTVLVVLLVLLNYLVYTADGLHDIAVLAYPAVIVIASLLLDRSTFIAYVVLLVLSLQALIYGELRALIVNRLSWYTSPADFVYAGVIMGVTAIVARLLADNIARNIARVRASQQALAESNRELKRVNDVLTREITDRERAERERERLLERVQEQAQQLQEIMMTVPDGILLLDNEERVIQANPPAQDYLSLLSDAKVGDLLPYLGERPIREWVSSAVYNQWQEVQLDRGGGETFPRTFEILVRLMMDQTSSSNYVMVLREITAQREIQARVQQQDRLAALGQLAAGIAHDFNNILAVIGLYTQLVSRSTSITSRDRERLMLVYQQVGRAKDLVQQILDFSRRAILDRRPLELVPFLKEQIELLKHTLPENILLELHYPDGEYIVNADPTRIQQAIMNLAVNARDAMYEGGALRIKLERLAFGDSGPADSAYGPSLTPDIGDWVCITVADTGHGIPQDILPHIFDPFFTTKSPGQGSGLGLSQVWGMINQHEGHINVTSDTTGTTFKLYLPSVVPPESRSDTPDTQALVYGKGQKILVVEDEPTTREALLESLEVLNYQGLEAHNGQDALAIYESHPDIALIISDMVMPVMSGKALLQALRKRAAPVKVILLTGHPLEKELEALTAEGLSDWLLKPVDLVRLAEVVAKVLAG